MGSADVEPEAEGAGVVTFAAVLFTIAGFFHGIEGLGAIFKKEYFNESSLLYSNLQVWGWGRSSWVSCRSRLPT